MSVADGQNKEVRFIDLQNKTHSLKEYRGKVSFIIFYASWCPSCVEELRAFELYYRSFREQGLSVIPIAIQDTREQIISLKSKYNITLPLYLDLDNSVSKAFDIQEVPATIVLGRDGKILKIKDPLYGNITEKIIGPRDWSSLEARMELQRMFYK